MSSDWKTHQRWPTVQPMREHDAGQGGVIWSIVSGPDSVVGDSSYCKVMPCVTSCLRSIMQCEHSSNWILPQIVTVNNGDPAVWTQHNIPHVFLHTLKARWSCLSVFGLVLRVSGLHLRVTRGRLWAELFRRERERERERGCARSLSLSNTCTSLAHFHTKLILNKSNVEKLYYKIMAQKLSFPVFLTENIMITKSCPVQ